MAMFGNFPEISEKIDFIRFFSCSTQTSRKMIFFPLRNGRNVSYLCPNAIVCMNKVEQKTFLGFHFSLSIPGPWLVSSHPCDPQRILPGLPLCYDSTYYHITRHAVHFIDHCCGSRPLAVNGKVNWKFKVIFLGILVQWEKKFSFFAK